MSWEVLQGDCRELMKSLPAGSVDAICADPPYGLGDRWTGGTWGANPMYEDARRWDVVIPQDTIDALVSLAKVSIIWGGNYYKMPPSRCLLSWDKNPRMDTMADFELAWTNLDRPSKSMTENRNPDGKRLHPTQKPLSVMLWCMSFLPEGCTVLDPFCGSGTTGVACVQTGRNFIGFELDPKYCEIARRRISEAVPLWAPEPVKAVKLPELFA